ncbi:MAG: pro-sigmaK processing inhibitor BofA family protein [Ruminococcus sp.]|nr:pro-sigmaK processing inhibitor BofA family protein [Ruminococcus sp.]MCM1380789.1 pro-sigmaK processing inhibitor BofA family protein [Muribaculaceae bacterium]MCM1478482.1 pro-sigmaK processing inhibitor BofA family protein [Muribaculaceae bacterium]
MQIGLAEIIFYGAGAVFALAALACCMRTEKPVRNAVKGMLTGVLALAAAHFFGGEIGLAVPINGLTAFIALVFGAPGVGAVCLIKMLIG